MSLKAEKQPEREPVVSKKEAVLWHGGIYFGGAMASLTFAIDLIRHTENYMPSRSPAALVLFSWGWMLIVTPLFWFGAGCLFGLVMWKLKEPMKGKSGS